MRTVDKLLKLNLNRAKRRFLQKSGIINWCWGKWGIDFDDLFDYVIAKFPQFNTKKMISLYEDFKKCCGEHDVKYWEGKSLIKRLLADVYLAYCFFKLLHWTKMRYRISVFLIVCIWLWRNWGKYYNYKEKKDINEFLTLNFDSWKQSYWIC